MGVDLRIYLAHPLAANSWWCDTSIELMRDNRLWEHINSKTHETVPALIEVHTYGADGNTKFVLDKTPYGERITYAEPKEFGLILMASGNEFNRRVGDLLVVVPEDTFVILYWH